MEHFNAKNGVVNIPYDVIYQFQIKFDINIMIKKDINDCKIVNSNTIIITYKSIELNKLDSRNVKET